MNAKQLIAGTALLIACLGALYFYLDPGSGSGVDSSHIGNLTFPIPARMPGQDQAATSPDPDALASLTARMANPLERAGDLRAIYDQHKNGKDPMARNIAYRAWSACFPTFIAPEGRPIPIEDITNALPPTERSNAQRIEAYRTLLGRCKNFSDMSREQILKETQRQKDAWISGEANSPGELAAKYLTDGNSIEALQAARSIAASKDPYAISSLREFVNQYFTVHNDSEPEHLIDRPDLRSLAFTIAACKMGMECGAASLTAIQLCANTGQCTGSAIDRYLQSLPNQADRDALLKETRRVTDAIQAGDYPALGF